MTFCSVGMRPVGVRGTRPPPARTGWPWQTTDDLGGVPEPQARDGPLLRLPTARGKVDLLCFQHPRHGDDHGVPANVTSFAVWTATLLFPTTFTLVLPLGSRDLLHCEVGHKHGPHGPARPS